MYPDDEEIEQMMVVVREKIKIIKFLMKYNMSNK